MSARAFGADRERAALLRGGEGLIGRRVDGGGSVVALW